MQALGLIEVKGMLSAIVVADAACKAANVELKTIEKVKGGLVTVLVVGDVGAVNAAVEASTNDIEPSLLISQHVIARPANNIEDMFVKEEIKEEVKVIKEDTTKKEKNTRPSTK